MGSEQLCNQGLLADMAALSNQINNPVAPFPVFFSTGSCGGVGGSAAGSNFPLYYFGVNCPSTSVPTPTDNCLRVIDNFDGHIGPGYAQTLQPYQVNYLPVSTDNINNIFPDPTSRLYSWYVPPGYRVIFFSQDPTVIPLSSIYQSKSLLITGPNYLEVDACLSFLTLENGQSFFKYGDTTPPGNSTNVKCPLQYCACKNADVTYPRSTNCSDGPQQAKPCPGVEHNARWFIVLKEGDFSDLLLDSCVNNVDITYGGDENNSLHKVWKPQSPACDVYITNLCSISEVNQTPAYAEMCSCFFQQQALNRQYGPTLQVPVCCFGTDPSGDIKKSCAFNQDAYKTADMIQNCCSFAECQTVIDQTPQMKVQASPPGEVQCDGQFIQFPIPYVTPTPPIPSVIVTEKSSIPLFTWLIFAVAVVLLLVFIFVLMFV